MKEEFTALQLSNPWELVEPEENMKIVGNKWVYKIKYNPDGTVSRYKARLVAKGYHQTVGVDYTETFSPIAKSATVKMMLSIAAAKGWEIKQVDVNNAFLNGELNKKVFMEQPKGFVDPKHLKAVCKLKKALYGLKQTPRAWYEKLKRALIEWGFKNAISNTLLFYQNRGENHLLVLVYVDNILTTGSQIKNIQKVIDLLVNKFAPKELGPLGYFLGIEMKRDESGMHLTQTKYIQDLLKKTCMKYCKGSPTPISTTVKYRVNLEIKEGGRPFEDKTLHRSVIGALQYATITRPKSLSV